MEKTAKTLLSCLTVCAALASTPEARADVQLPAGRYIGWVQASGSDRKVALTLNTFVEQPNDTDQFPQLDAVVKVSLGGPKGDEYVSEYYPNALYDYTDGVLTLSNAQSDVAMTLTVTSAESTSLDGHAFMRSAGVSGVVHFDLYDPDNPDAPNGGVPPVDMDAPLLAGQYRGVCDGKTSYLQIETGKGFYLSDNATHGLVGYEISGRLGVVDPSGGLCLAGYLCSYRSYHDSNFDLFSGRLVLNSDLGTDTCQMHNTGATCEFHLGQTTARCDLARDPTPIAPAMFPVSPYALTVTAAQRAKLPPLHPPGNTELTTALSGDYTGYMFNESTSHYQVARLSVLASTSTNNPHNDNLVYVTGGATLHFGKAISTEFFVQPFEPRSFYLTNGFTLESPDSDTFVQITDWRVGYISGVWLSHAFGRVGTFEMIKGTDLPPLDARATFVPSPAGNFAGSSGQVQGAQWWVTLVAPNQPAPRESISTLDFVGDYMLVDTQSGGNLTRKMPLERGEFDMYTGSIAWLTTEEEGGNRLIKGHVLDNGSLTLVWPSTPHIGMLVNPDHTEKPYGTRR